MNNFDIKMTAMADEIRELSGITTSKSLDTMASDIKAANEEITGQTELLEQIITTLENKMSGNNYGEVPENVTDFYTHTLDDSGLGYRVGLNTNFYSALEAGEDYIVNGELLLKAGDPLPNPGSTYNGKPITDMSAMFEACRATKLDLSKWDTSNVTTMRYMFSSCGYLESLNISGFNTSKVTDMISMFGGCYVLTTLDLSSFDTSNVTDMSEIFGGCYQLVSIFARTEADKIKFEEASRLANGNWTITVKSSGNDSEGNGGSSGGSIETCTVTIVAPNPEDRFVSTIYCLLTIVENGVVVNRFVSDSATFTNVVKNSEITMINPEGFGHYGFDSSLIRTGGMLLNLTLSSGELLECGTYRLTKDNTTIEIYA